MKVVSTLTNLEVGLALQKIGKSSSDMIYVLDSLGSLQGEKLTKLFKKFRKSCDEWDKWLGFHPHNNLGLPFLIHITIEKFGVDIVDGTITGMGRGCGNLRIEQYLMWKKKPTKNLLDLVQRKFEPMNGKIKMGLESKLYVFWNSRNTPVLSTRITNLSHFRF